MALQTALLGCGTIGTEIGKAICGSTIPNATLSAVFDLNTAAIEAFQEQVDEEVPVSEDIAHLCEGADLVIEAAGQKAVAAAAEDVLDTGTDLMIMSVGALSDSSLRERLFTVAEEKDLSLYFPTGAIAGIDAVKAANVTGELESVSLTTRKPPSGLKGAPYIEANDIDLASFEEKQVVFEGTAKAAADAFPSNINVAVSLSLAGIGIDETTVRIVADPAESNNVHQIEAHGGAGTIETTVSNVPSPTNPKTSYLASLSAIEKIRRMTTTVSLGT